MTFALAVIFFAVLLMYCGIKGASLKDALLGHATPTASKAVIQ